MAVTAERSRVVDFSQVSLTPDPEVVKRMREITQCSTTNETRYIHPALAAAAILTGAGALYFAPTILKVIEAVGTK